jgi:hypothetical protein
LVSVGCALASIYLARFLKAPKEKRKDNEPSEPMTLPVQ